MIFLGDVRLGEVCFFGEVRFGGVGVSFLGDVFFVARARCVANILFAASVALRFIFNFMAKKSFQ